MAERDELRGVGATCPLCHGSGHVDLPREPNDVRRTVCLNCSFVWRSDSAIVAVRPAAGGASARRRGLAESLFQSPWARARAGQLWQVLQIGDDDEALIALLAARGHACTVVAARQDAGGGTGAGEGEGGRGSVTRYAEPLGRIAFEGRPFDVVLVGDRPATAAETVDALRHAHGALRPEGLIVVQTPNVELLVTPALDAEGHLEARGDAAFSPVTLRLALAEAGFSSLDLAGGEPCEVAGRVVPRTLRARARPGATKAQTPDPAALSDEARRLLRSARAAVAARREVARRTTERVGAACAGGRPLYLWGSREHVDALLARGCLHGARVVAVIDEHPESWGGECAGHRILSPEDLLARLRVGGGVVLLPSRATRDALAQALGVAAASSVALLAVYDDEAAAPATVAATTTAAPAETVKWRVSV